MQVHVSPHVQQDHTPPGGHCRVAESAEDGEASFRDVGTADAGPRRRVLTEQDVAQ